MSKTFQDQASNISPEIYQRFRQALELGKWPDGRPLTAAQKEICMEAVLLYEQTHSVSEQDRVGYIDRSRKIAPCGDDDHEDDDDPDSDVDPVRILH
jgi:uncharacterized protein YeaC (DUF1315 family)